jgi:CheY-like chemotaxis protein
MRSTTEVPTILVVEDDSDTRTTVCELLAEQGYQVAQSADGREAESYLRNRPPPSCMVLDLMMPRMDGWAVASLMRQGVLPQVPLVVITAAEDWWGYPAPSERVLKKPIKVDKLLAAIRNVAPLPDPAQQ